MKPAGFDKLELKKILPEDLRLRLNEIPLGEREMFQAGRNFARLLAP
jgi:hypothetical protein